MRLVVLFALVLLATADGFTSRIVAKKNLEPRYRAALQARMAPPLGTAQIRGTQFATAFINSHNSAKDTSYTENLAFIITNVNTDLANVMISSSYAGFKNFTVSIPSGVSQVVPITPADIQTNYMNQGDLNQAEIENKSVWIDSNVPISVVASNSHSDGSGEDKYDVYPICTLGTEYHVAGDESLWLSHTVKSTNMFTIVAVEDDTWVDLSVLLSSGNITLNKGQTVSFATMYFISDVVIRSGKNVAIITGSVCGFGYLIQNTCSFEALMLYPTSVWNKDAYYYKYQPEDIGEVMIMAKDDKTMIKFDGQATTAPLDRDSYMIVNFPTGSAITSDKQIQVVAVGSSASQNGYGAPFFVYVPSTENFITDPIQFLVGINDDEASNMIHIVRIETHVKMVGKIALDSHTPGVLLYTRMGQSSVYFAEISVAPGVHTVTPEAGVSYSVTVYGYGYQRQYAYTPALSIPTNGGSC